MYNDIFRRFLNVFLLFTIFSISAQDIFKTQEDWWKENGLKGYGFYGYNQGNPVLLERIEWRNNNYKGIEALEDSKEVRILTSRFTPPYPTSDLLTGYVAMKRFNNNMWVYRELFSDDEFTTFYYQNLWLQYQGKDYLLDSIYNADKLIHSSFSTDGRYLLVNTLNTLSDYYNPAQDNRIMVFDLSEIDQGKIGRDNIPCTHCSDAHLVGDQLFFTIGRADGYGGYDNKDIYVAPWGSMEDTVKIADNIKIKAISPDGKYILGTRFWDLQRDRDVVVDVAQKKYQMLLGRDYSKRRAFYSYHEKKFAYSFKGYLIYMDYPETYPFDALKWRNEEIPTYGLHEEFWKQYEHPPLPEE